MANTFFKYAERNAENRINWADVGKDMTDMLSEEARVREEKKAAIETDFRDFNETLSDSPVGDSDGFNEFTTDYANSASEYSLMVNNMLKSGDLKLRDYNSINANLKQGTAEAFSIAEDYNAAYKGMLERGQVDPETGLPSAQLLEQYVLGTVQGFGNFSDHRLWINPATGRVSLGTTQTDADGVITMNRDTGSFQAVNGLRNRTKAKYDIYDLEKASNGIVTSLAETVMVIMKDEVKTLSEATQNEYVVDAIDQFIKGSAAIPTNTSSLLTNTVVSNPSTGDNYGFTDNPADAAADENLILLIDNPLQPSSPLPMPAFLDSPKQLKAYLKKNHPNLKESEIAAIVENNTKQQDVAADAVRISILSKIDKKQTAMTEFNPDSNYAAKAAGRENLRVATTAVTNLADVWWGDESETGAGLGFLQGLDPNVVKFYIDPLNSENVLIDRMINGKLETMIPFPKGDSVVDFVSSIYTSLVPGGKNLAKALEDSGIGNAMQADGVTPRKKTTHQGAAGIDYQATSGPRPFDEVVAGGAPDLPMTSSQYHDDAFKDVGSQEGRKQASAEKSVLSQSGILDAEVNYMPEVEAFVAEFSSFDYPATSIYVPGVMNMPILVPENQTNVIFKEINRLIMDSYKFNPPKRLSPNDFKRLFSKSSVFDKYNNKDVTDEFFKGFDWDGGVGSNKAEEAKATQDALDKKEAEAAAAAGAAPTTTTGSGSLDNLGG